MLKTSASLVAVAAVLAACGGGGGGITTPPPSSSLPVLGEATGAALNNCAALANFGFANTTISAATSIAAGTLTVAGKAVTGFSNAEEAAVNLTEVVPFLVEDMLKANGGNYTKAADWQPHVAADGLLITGQNPASSEPVAEALLAALRRA